MCAFAAFALMVAPLRAQDTIQNTGGAQLNSSATDQLPPPTPPNNGVAPDNKGVPQPGSPERAQALEASQNAAYSVEQPVQDQSLIPPQLPPQVPTTQPSLGGQAQLGVQMLPSDGPGVRVSNVLPGSAADLAGVRAGDYLLAVGNESVELPSEVTNIILRHKPGDTVKLRIWRNRDEQMVTANLQQMQANRPQPTTVNRPVYTEDPVYYESNVVGGYVPNTVYRQYYYPNNYGAYGYAPYGYRYGWGTPYRGAYYGTPRFGYWNSPWGEGVNIGGFRFGWR